MEIKPFSEDITTGDELSPEDGISVNRELTAKEKKMLESVPENKKLPGFAGYYEKEQTDILLKMGFSKAEISDVEKLYRRGPEAGYTRYTNPKIAPKGSDANVVIKTWGFADIDKNGFMHPDISYAESNVIPQGNYYHKDKGWY